MNNNSENNKLESDELDELVLDRLVDNDLSEEEYREVLRLVEQKPDGWQKLALAFLESQAFENELSALHGDGAESNPLAFDPSSQSERMNQLDVEKGQGLANSKPSTGKPKPNKNDNGQSNIWINFRVAFPAIAACFAIAFVAGLYVREIQEKKEPRIVNVGELGNDSAEKNSDSNYLEVVSNGNKERVKTPVLNHKQFDADTFANNIANLKPKLENVVRQSGLHANEKTHMVPIEDRSGNRMIVPLKEIQLSPNKFEDFQ